VHQSLGGCPDGVWVGGGRQQASSPEQHHSNDRMFFIPQLYEEYYWEQMKLSGVLLQSSVNALFPYPHCSLLRRRWPTVISKAIRAWRSCLEHRQRSFLQRFKAVIEPADRRLPVLAIKPRSWRRFLLPSSSLPTIIPIISPYKAQFALQPLLLAETVTPQLLQKPPWTSSNTRELSLKRPQAYLPSCLRLNHQPPEGKPQRLLLQIALVGCCR
jgi:hypothetical protein